MSGCFGVRKRDKMEAEEGGSRSMIIDLSDELVRQALSLSMKAHQNNQQHYISNFASKKKPSTTPLSDVVIFAFPGSWEDNHWFHDHGLFGETPVDPHVFPSLRRIGEDKLAMVNKAFLERFQKLLQDSEFEMEVKKTVIEGKKKIVLTGHSSGGATAMFATIWILEKYTRQQGIQIPFRCVTFGSPLVGDSILSHALRREKWAGYFTHVVMELDIVPRIMLAPFSSIQEQLPHVLEVLQQKVTFSSTSDHKTFKVSKIIDRIKRKKNNDHDQDHDRFQPTADYRALAIAFFENVLVNASAVASFVANDVMVPTSSLMDKLLSDFVKVSPYRPFGTYIFLTRNEDHNLVVDNPDAVLQLLFYFCQLSDEDQSLADFALKSLDENLSYEAALNDNGFQLQNMVNLKVLNDHLVTPNGTPGDVVRMKNKALYELSTRARLCLLAAEEEEKRKKENEKRIYMLIRKTGADQKKIKRTEAEETKKSKDEDKQKSIEELLHEIGEYKQKFSEGKMGYYDAFRLQENLIDFGANVNRLQLASIWDEIVEMLVRQDLPDEFEGRQEWVDLGTEFRRLVEPLDVANYYRHLKGQGSFTYLKVRPKRYKFTQRWHEHASRKPFVLVSESNILAEVEELMKDFEEPQRQTFDEIKERVVTVETQVQKWVFDDKILGDDVLLAESTLSKWWRGLPEDHKSQSALRPTLSTPLS